MSNWSEFITTSKIFDEQSFSRQFRTSMVRTLQGLGLPTPIYGKRAPFGYYKEGRVFLPIENDLSIYLTAIEMFDSGEYFLDDCFTWFNSAPVTRQLSERMFKEIKALRPLFPEFRLTPEERIALLNGTTSSSAQKACPPTRELREWDRQAERREEEEQEGYRQAEYGA